VDGAPGGPAPYICGMSRAFVREQDDVPEELPERPLSQHPNDVTPEGLAQIEAAMAGARAALGLAQAANDRQGIATASRDLRYWTARRASASVIAPGPPSGQVRFGSSVTIVRNDGREQTFRIVGEDEADPAHGTISHVSPIARAMFGRSVGDVVKAGAGEAEIVRIE
jgi:transcription elongation GreA/GreB family factor